MLHVCIQHDMFEVQKGQIHSCLWHQRRPIQERFTTCKTCQVLASDTIVGMMLNDVVAKYKKWIKWSFMSLTGLAYNRVIECEAKVNLHDDDRRVINANWGFFVKRENVLKNGNLCQYKWQFVYPFILYFSGFNLTLFQK